MSGLLEHFKPPPLASDPPEKTRYFPAPPKGGAGGILQRTSEASSSTCPSPISRVSFAPLPDLAPRKRRNSITLGVAARSATLRRNREAGPQPTPPKPQQPNPPRPQRHAQYVYPGPPRPRARRAGNAHYKDDQVVDLGEVAMDAGKKLWRAINNKSRKTSTASDSGRPTVESHAVGGPTVGAMGHNTEREISVRGFAVPEEDEDECENEGEVEEDDEEEAQHRTEDYVAGIQAMHISDTTDVHPTRLSPPPLLPEGSDGTSSSNVSTPSQEQEPLPEARKDTLF